MDRSHAILFLFVVTLLMVVVFGAGYEDGKKLTLDSFATLPDSATVLVSGKLPFSPEVDALREYPGYASATIVEEISLVGSRIQPSRVYATYRILLKSKKNN